MKVTGYHISDGMIATSDPSIVDIKDTEFFLNWLLQDNKDSIKVFYQLDYCVANLIKMIGLTEKEGRELNSKGRLSIPPYKLSYIKKKFFSIKKNEEFCFYSDVSQYIKWFDSESLDVKNFESNIRMCMNNALKAKEIGQEVYNALDELNLNPTSLVSPIRAYEKAVLDKMDIPTVDDIPEEAGLYAYECCKHNWVESFKIGHFEKTWDYDLTSAYPSQIANLVDIRLGDWYKVDRFNPLAYYGYYKCDINIVKEFNPIIMILKKSGFGSTRFTPIGERPEFLNQKQIKFIDKWELGSVEVIDGWIWIPKQEKYIFRNHIADLYNKKENAIGIKREAIKRIPNGIYGKFLESRNGELGDRFNPVYGAEVEIPIQLKVAELALSNGILPIHIAVDGLLSDKELVLPKEDGLGSWRLTGVQPAICVGSGVVAVKGKDKSGDFSLDYDWLKKSIENDPEAGAYVMKKKGFVSLSSALQVKEWSKLGSIKEVTKSVDMGYENKRMYHERPENGGEMISGQYVSHAIDFGTVMMKNVLDEDKEIKAMEASSGK